MVATTASMSVEQRRGLRCASLFVAFGLVAVGAVVLPSATATATAAALTSMEELQALFDRAGDQTIVLEEDVTAGAGERLLVPADASEKTLDLNGFDLAIDSPVSARAAVSVRIGADLLITDSSASADGSLIVSGGLNAAGIGGDASRGSGRITVAGGTVTATGGDYGAGIGAGAFRAGGDTSVTGGLVTATGGVGAAGIGGGVNGAGGGVTVSGGTVTATSAAYDRTQAGAGIGGGYLGAGGSLTVAGGTVTATGAGYGAGIGGGNLGTGGAVTVSGGTVTASGGDYAAGIGGGDGAIGGDVTVSDGTVYAIGGAGGAGIGGGDARRGGTVSVSGGSVVAEGGVSGAGIGGGRNGAGGSVLITGGDIAATGGSYAAGIGGGDGGEGAQVVVSGGVITATGGVSLLSAHSGGAAIGTGGLRNASSDTSGGTVLYQGSAPTPVPALPMSHASYGANPANSAVVTSDGSSAREWNYTESVDATTASESAKVVVEWTGASGEVLEEPSETPDAPTSPTPSPDAEPEPEQEPTPLPDRVEPGEQQSEVPFVDVVPTWADAAGADDADFTESTLTELPATGVEVPWIGAGLGGVMILAGALFAMARRQAIRR